MTLLPVLGVCILSTVPAVSRAQPQGLDVLALTDAFDLADPLADIEAPRRAIGTTDLPLPWRLRVRSQAIRSSRAMEGTGLNPWKTLWRLDLDAGRWGQGHLVSEKDAGEAAPFDFLSGYAAWSGTNSVRRLVVGDYLIDVGQGLLFGRYPRALRGPTFFKLRESEAVGYRSVSENRALRGFYVETVRGPVVVTLFGSSTRYDAATSSAGLTERVIAEGTHVTPLDLERENALHERLMVGRVGWQFGGIGDAALLVGRSAFVPALAPNVRADEELATGSHRRANLVSATWNLSLGRTTVFGETARGVGDRWAAVGGIDWTAQRARFALQARRFSQGFRSIHGAPLAHDTEARETGIAWVARWRPGARVVTQTYGDLFRHPLGRESAVGPETGRTVGVVVKVRPMGAWRATLDARDRLREWRELGARPGPPPGAFREFRRRMRVRAQVEHGRWRGRLEGLRGERESPARERSIGWLAHLDWTRSWRGRSRVAARIAAFDGPNLDAAPYEVEGDLPGRSFARALVGRGFRAYVVLGRRLGWLEVVGKVRGIWRRGRSPAGEVGLHSEARL